MQKTSDFELVKCANWGLDAWVKREARYNACERDGTQFAFAKNTLDLEIERLEAFALEVPLIRELFLFRGYAQSNCVNRIRTHFRYGLAHSGEGSRTFSRTARSFVNVGHNIHLRIFDGFKQSWWLENIAICKINRDTFHIRKWRDRALHHTFAIFATFSAETLCSSPTQMRCANIFATVCAGKFLWLSSWSSLNVSERMTLFCFMWLMTVSVFFQLGGIIIEYPGRKSSSESFICRNP